MNAAVLVGTALLLDIGVSLVAAAFLTLLVRAITRNRGLGLAIDILLGILLSLIGFGVVALFGIYWAGLENSIVLSSVGALLALAIARATPASRRAAARRHPKPAE